MPLPKAFETIKICHVITALSLLGGAERMLIRLLLANPELSHNRMVLVLCRAGIWGEKLRFSGVIVHELGMKSALDIPRIFWQLKQLIRQFDPDIVQTWLYHADFLGGLAAYFSGYKSIIWSIRRTSPDGDPIATRILMKLCALLSHLIPKSIISVAEAGKQSHIAIGYKAEPMVVIPNGFDFENLTATIEQRNALRSKYKILGDELVIGCMGRFHFAKGQDYLIKAANLISQKHPGIKFMMVGLGCDEDNSKLSGWIAEHNLQNCFVLLGERQDVSVCLAAMDIFCMPSRTEGFPNALGEAMAMGLPCVVTDVGDTSILAGDAAILVPPQDELMLADALSKLIAMSNAQRINFGLKAKTRVINEFSIQKSCERYNAVYRQLMSLGLK